MASYTVVVAGTPPRKNRRHVIVRNRLINSKEFKVFTLVLQAAWQASGHPKINSGIWSLTIHSTWPRSRHMDVNVPLGDVDAPVSSILDAFQLAGLLDDDARVMRVTAGKSQGKEPSTLVTLEQI